MEPKSNNKTYRYNQGQKAINPPNQPVQLSEQLLNIPNPPPPPPVPGYLQQNLPDQQNLPNLQNPPNPPNPPNPQNPPNPPNPT